MLGAEQTRSYCKILKALAHPTRISIVHMLMNGERSMGEIAKCFDFDLSTISKHLAQLCNVDLLTRRKEGSQVYYHLLTPCIAKCLTCIVDNVEEMRQGSASAH